MSVSPGLEGRQKKPNTYPQNFPIKKEGKSDFSSKTHAQLSWKSLPVQSQIGAMNKQSLAGCKESRGSLGLCLGLENEDQTQKESDHLSPRLE